MPKGAIICSTAKDAEIWENLVGVGGDSNNAAQEMKNVAPLIYGDGENDDQDYEDEEESQQRNAAAAGHHHYMGGDDEESYNQEEESKEQFR